jgi:hypothetical protein
MRKLIWENEKELLHDIVLFLGSKWVGHFSDIEKAFNPSIQEIYMRIKREYEKQKKLFQTLKDEK